MKISGWEFADGARFQAGEHPEASVVGAHIEMLREKFRGEITPEDILEDAKNDNSPLHSFFEWNDGDAAHQHRLQQARGLIRSVVAIYTHPDRPATRMKAYVHIPDKEPHYREAGHAMSVKKTRDMVLQRAWSEFQQWRKRYESLKEFSDLFEVADEVGHKITKRLKKAG